MQLRFVLRFHSRVARWGWVRRAKTAVLTTILATAGVPPALAQKTTEIQPANGEPIVFRLALQTLAADRVQVFNGVRATLEDWQALLIAGIVIEADAAGTKRTAHCTATLIGPKTVLMAAHCVDKGPLGGVRDAAIKPDGHPAIPLRCSIHPDYLAAPYAFGSPRASADFALCALNSAIGSLPADFLFESIDTNNPLLRGTYVLLTGYGCDDVKFVGGELVTGRSDSILRIGDQRVDKAATGQGTDANYALLRSALSQSPALCPGDSGGPLISGATTTNQVAPRRVRAVNSSLQAVKPGTLNPADARDAGVDLISRVADLGQPSFRNFLRAWLAAHPSVGIVCGYGNTAGRGSCR